MAPTTVFGGIFTTTLVAAATAGAAYAVCVRNRITLAQGDQIYRSDEVPESFTQSRTMRELVNPRHYRAGSDTHAIAFKIPAHRRDVTDEVLLSRFVRGFFGGLVLGPERAVLSTLGLTLVHFNNAPSKNHIWSISKMPQDELPPPGSILLGAFQTLDIQLAGAPAEKDARATESYIDFGFGSNEGGFCGMHRFVVARPEEDVSDAQIQIRMESTHCNPTVDKRAIPWPGSLFHNIYAELLFREAVWYVRGSLE